MLVFNKVPEAKIVKNRLHLDLVSDTFDGESERLLSLGARRLSDQQAGKSRWTTFADIEGNEFDLIAGSPPAHHRRAARRPAVGLAVNSTLATSQDSPAPGAGPDSRCRNRMARSRPGQRGVGNAPAGAFRTVGHVEQERPKQRGSTAALTRPEA